MSTLRQINALLGIIALGLLLFRLISTWPDLVRGTRVLGVLLASTLAVGAVGSWALSRASVVDTSLSSTVSGALLVVRSSVILVCLAWHRLLDTKT